MIFSIEVELMGATCIYFYVYLVIMILIPCILRCFSTCQNLKNLSFTCQTLELLVLDLYMNLMSLISIW